MRVPEPHIKNHRNEPATRSDWSSSNVRWLHSTCVYPCTVYRIASVGKTEKRHTTQFPCIRHSHRMGSECVLCGFVRVFTLCIIFVSFISILYGASTAFMKLIFGYCVENGSGAVHRRCRVQLTKLINIDLWSTISMTAWKSINYFFFRKTEYRLISTVIYFHFEEFWKIISDSIDCDLNVLPSARNGSKE